MPDPVRLPVRERPEIDPLVAELVEAYQTQAAAQDRRHAELVEVIRASTQAAEAREVRRDEQHAAVLKSVGEVTAQMSATTVQVGALASEVKTLTGRVPDRTQLWAGGAFLAFLVLAILALYAQSRGDDAGKAFDDARRALPVNAAALEDGSSDG
jgi:phage-related tail protein